MLILSHVLLVHARTYVSGTYPATDHGADHPWLVRSPGKIGLEFSECETSHVILTAWRSFHSDSHLDSWRH